MNELATTATASGGDYGISLAGMAPGLMLMFNDRLYERCKDIARNMAAARGFTPPHLIDKPAGCLAVVTRSITWKLDPFAVAQATYETPGGKVGFEGKLVQAILENSGQLVGGVKFEMLGDWEKIRGRWKKGKSAKGYDVPQQDWTDAEEAGLGVRVYARVKGEQEDREFVMWLRECFPRNSTLWPLRPEQQIRYTAVRAFANIAAPGLFMGVPFNSDVDDGQLVDVTPAPERPERSDFLPASTAAAEEAKPAEPELSAADAFEAGRRAREDGRALKAVPPEWRDNPLTQNFADAWGEGWRERDAEIAAETKQK